MSKIANKITLLISIVCLFILMLSACKDPIEGCRDVEAVNYDVSADKACEDCCTYPSLSLQVLHRFDTLSFSLDSLYNLFGDDTIRFEQSIFYLSNFRLEGPIDTFEVIDSMIFNVLGSGASTFKDDFTLVSRSISSFNYNVGEIRGAGEYTTLKFVVGLLGDASIIDATTVVEEHDLAIQEDTLWTATQGYTLHQIVVTPDTSQSDVTRKFAVMNVTQEIELPFDSFFTLGSGIQIPLKIDYKKWFEGIDFVAGSEVDVVNEIVNNTANAFSISE